MSSPAGFWITCCPRPAKTEKRYSARTEIAFRPGACCVNLYFMIYPKLELVHCSISIRVNSCPSPS